MRQNEVRSARGGGGNEVEGPGKDQCHHEGFPLSKLFPPFVFGLCQWRHYGLLWATGFVPAENGGAPEIFKTSWGLDRQ